MPLKKSFYLVLAVAIIGILPHAADAGLIPVGAQLTLTGVSGPDDGHYFIDPYKGTINGGQPPVDIWCVDFAHESYIGKTWTVNVTTPVSGGNFQNTYLNNEDKYRAILWLIGIYNHPGYISVEVQHAIWSYSGYTNLSQHEQGLITEANLNAGGVDLTKWNILTPDAKSPKYQEFAIDPSLVPEPGFLLLLTLGIGAVSLVTWLAGGSRQ